MLEASLHSENAFCTLTYTTESLPTSVGGPTLEPKHLQDFLKRLRKVIAPRLIRFYAVGEYGDQTFRPHYHLALFNFPTCSFGRSRYGLLNRKNCCYACDLVRDSWSLGQIDLGTLEVKSAQYIAGYVTKKMTHSSDPRLAGRHPEFSRMSLRPGLGKDMMPYVAQTLIDLNLDLTQPDVPSALRHGPKELPLGQYLRRNLRKMIGRDPKTPPEVLAQMDAEMLPVRAAAFDASLSLKEVIVDKNKGNIDQAQSRERIFKQRKPL